MPGNEVLEMDPTLLKEHAVTQGCSFLWPGGARDPYGEGEYLANMQNYDSRG